MNRTDRKLQSREDERLTSNGIDLEPNGPASAAAMARLLYAQLEEAKRTGNVDAAVTFLYTKVSATSRQLGAVPVACHKGCAECCHRSWVSVTAPEIFFIAKIVMQRGESLVRAVRGANAATEGANIEDRVRHRHPCPMLDGGVCSIYGSRPVLCRLSASVDAAICALPDRSQRSLAPFPYALAASGYTLVLASALRQGRLPFYSYELNAGLVRAFDRPNAEQAWLGGEDVFSGVAVDPASIRQECNLRTFSEIAFGRT